MALASLVPCAAFLVTVAIADAALDETLSIPRLLAVAPLYLGFVALPSSLPIAAARSSVLRILVVVAMSAVAVFAGAELVASDDAQAGLAVLLVAFVAIPLAFVVWIGESITAKRRAAGAVDDQGAGPVDAQPSERLAALGIDAAIIVGVLVVPLTALSKSGPDIADYAAGVIAVVVGTLYLGALVAARGGTIGHALCESRSSTLETRAASGSGAP